MEGTPASSRAAARPIAGHLTAVEEKRLIGAAQAGDARARERLVVSRLSLLSGLAYRYRGLGLAEDDLRQEGAIGLLEAIEHFDLDRDVRFSTYAYWRVRQAMTHALTERGRLVRLPKEIVERRRAIALAAARLSGERGHEPSRQEIAAKTGLSLAAVAEALDIPTHPTSLDDGAGERAEPSLADASTVDPSDAALAREQARLVSEAVAQLPPRQQTLIAHHFGLDRPAETLEDISIELDVSKARARAIERDALYNLATSLQSKLGPGSSGPG